MERTDHVMLVGEGALRFARMHGFEETNLLTEKSRLAWLKWKENLSDKDDWIPPPDGVYSDAGGRVTGTINVLAIDAAGDLAGCTTTSGLAWKISGRLGDSPIIGAGMYVDNEVGAVGATGRGEEVIKTCGSYAIVEAMRRGTPPEQACREALQRIVHWTSEDPNFDVKYVALRKDGEVACVGLRGKKDKPPLAAVQSAAGFRMISGSYLYEQKDAMR
jgi:N4-(beta-N-acetylglucosaminyl)-L-asparaginase